LKILSGQITPDKGTLKMADDLKIVVFDQHREHLPPHITLREALSPNGDTVNYRGQQIHVNGWAKKFLFPSDRLSMPINKLSGGERARILIARLMLEPADLLFLDEPTNDLDIPTLEIIEESLCEFRGAVVLISHDRCLMDRVCTQLIGLGIPSEHPFYADYAQWEKACADFQVEKEAAEKSIPTPLSPRPKKLSYKEQKELDGMEASITAAEQEITTLQHILDMPTTQTNPQKTLEIYKQLGSAQEKLDALFERWEWLQKKQTT
jgi:ATP-binding cassette subfamily F protein uup